MQAFYGSYLGDNLWSQYGDSTKSTMMDTLKQMLILEQHQDEYNVSLTDDDKKKIDEAAQQFMDDNAEIHGCDKRTCGTCSGTVHDPQ